MHAVRNVIITILILLCVGTVSAGTAFNWTGQHDTFFWSSLSDVSTYRTMDQIPQLASQTSITSPPVSTATGEVILGTWITPKGSPDTDTLAPGLWRFRTYARSSSSSGTTTMKFYAVNRSASGIETNLFYGNAVTPVS